LGNSILAGLKKARLVVVLFGREVEIFGEVKGYVRPFLQVETRNGTRIFNESIVKEITPLD
jgi:hypothetical protein